jgi:hypothetical protein
METNLGKSARGNGFGCNATQRDSAARLILRMAFGGLALLLWQASPAKAQDCCPDQFTETELARVESSARTPVNTAATKERQGNAAAEAKVGSGVTQGSEAAGSKKSKVHVRQAAPQRTAKGWEAKAPAASNPPRRLEAVGNGPERKSAGSQAVKDAGAAGR